jgi:hypothetical protein
VLGRPISEDEIEPRKARSDADLGSFREELAARRRGIDPPADLDEITGR